MSDQALLQKARCFDELALAEIYDSYSPGIYRYAYRLAGDEMQAEECVSETFSRFLWALQKGGGPRDHLQAYLYRIAHNWITDGYRRRSLDPLPLDPDIHSRAEGEPHQVVDDELERQQVRLALRKLTPEQSQVVVLKYLEGWDNEEIARSLGKSIGSVKSLQHRALQALRRILEAEENQHGRRGI